MTWNFSPLHGQADSSSYTFDAEEEYDRCTMNVSITGVTNNTIQVEMVGYEYSRYDPDNTCITIIISNGTPPLLN